MRHVLLILAAALLAIAASMLLGADVVALAGPAHVPPSLGSLRFIGGAYVAAFFLALPAHAKTAASSLASAVAAMVNAFKGAPPAPPTGGMGTVG